MDFLIDFINTHVQQAHFVLFFFMLLGGLCLPVSEDLLLIASGALGSVYLQDHVIRLGLWLFFACWLSSWETYWIGRSLGPKLFEIRWLSHLLSKKRLEKWHSVLERFGFFTFLVGRFIPGGARNAIFLTAGFGKMPFYTFITRDFFACTVSVPTLFTIGYIFGEKAPYLIELAKYYEKGAIITFLSLATVWLFYSIIKMHRKHRLVSAQNERDFNP